MPIHNWLQVDAGRFHAFQNAWIVHLQEMLNGGILPDSFYAIAEQHAGRVIADVLTLQVPQAKSTSSPDVFSHSSAVAVTEAPPRTSRKAILSPSDFYHSRKRTLAIRKADDHRTIAFIEIVSRSNKDRLASVEEFVEKATSILRGKYHLLFVDLFPPTPHDPNGLAGAICDTFEVDEWNGQVVEQQFRGEVKFVSPQKPLTAASFAADSRVAAYVEPLAVGDNLPDMPLFLDPGWYVNVPLESTYMAAFRGMPAITQKELTAAG